MATPLSIRLGSLATLLALAGCASSAPILKGKPEQQLGTVLELQKKANIAYQDGNIAEAVQDYTQLTQMIPDEPNYWFLLGNALVKEQEPDQAVVAYNQAIIRNPRHTRAWHNLGVIRLRQAQAAFVSSAETANAGDPIKQNSRRVAEALARVNDVPKSASPATDQVIEDAPVPVPTPAQTQPLQEGGAAAPSRSP
jgi:Flp pilus assembly protein TadD